MGINLIDLQVTNKDIFYLTPVIKDLEVYHGGFCFNFFIMEYLDPSTYYIYVTTDLTNDKQYIGCHQLYSRTGINYKGSGTEFKKEEKNKGTQNFTTEIIDWYGTEQDALLAESYYVYNFESYHPYGYNDIFGLKSIDNVYVWLQEQISNTFRQ